MDLPTSIIFEKLLRIILTLFLGILSVFYINRSVNATIYRISRQRAFSSHRTRLQTINSIIKSAISSVIFLIAILILASDFGFNISPILAGAGIVGLAVSFGAQTLIKDVLAGIFLIIDNQINIGDKVKIGETIGTIEKLGLRTMVIKDKDDNVIYIPNSEIKQIKVFKERVA